MQPAATTWVRLNHILEQLEKIEQESCLAMKDHPDLLQIRGVVELAGQLKGVVHLAASARDAADPRSLPRPVAGAPLPSSHIANVIRCLPRAGPDAAPVLMEIDAEPTPAWNHQGRYRLAFRARRNPRAEIRGWYWGIDRCERLSPGA